MKFWSIPRVESNIVDYFSEAGFSDVQLENVALSFNGVRIEKAYLDKDPFNSASNITANLSWPSYLFGGKFKSIEIKTLNLSSVVDRPKDVLKFKHILSAPYLKHLTAQDITISNIIWDVALPQKAIRFNGKAKIIDADGVKKISGTLTPAQHDLSFNSQWSGHVNENGTFLIESTFNNLDTNSQTLQIKRGSGFLSLNGKGDVIKAIAQLDAGSGHMLRVPVKNISLILDQTDEGYPVTFRAQAVNLEETNIVGDFVFSEEIENQMFDLSLNINNQNKFIKILEQENILKNTSPKPYNAEPTNFKISYQAQDRFAGGPLPFIVKNDSDNIKGTFLIYPDNLDVRGALQSDKSTVNFIQHLFNTKDEQVSETSIRFDENLKALF